MQFEPVEVAIRAAGLANTKATVVVQSVKDHCFWISTSGSGVSRFDQASQVWQTFTEADGLANPDVRSMILTVDGELWFGTSNGASHFSPQSQQWQSYFMSNGLPNNSVWSLLEDSGRQIWFGTNGGGLSRYNVETSEWKTYTGNDGLAGNIIQALLEDDFGDIWVGTKTGLSKLNIKTNTWASFYQQDGLANNNVRSLAKDDRGNIWIGTVLGLSCYQIKDDSWKTYTTDQGLGSDYIQALNYRDGGTLWAGTRMGVSAYDTSTDQWQTLTQQDGLTDNEVWGLLEDEQNRLWVATWGGGVSLYSPSLNSWETYTAPSEFADTYALSVIKSVNHHVWIGTYGAISRYAIDNGAWLTLSSAEGLPNNNVQALAEDSEANVWVGTSGGLIRYQPQDGSWLVLSQDDGLINNNVNALLYIKGIDELWIGTASGLCCYQLSGQHWQSFSDNGLSTANIHCLALDADARLWVGTNQGLFVRHENNTWQHFTCEDGLLNAQVNALAVGSDDSIWIGTQGGLNAFRPSDAQWQSFTEAQGLANNKVRALLFNNNELWIACAQGGFSCYETQNNRWETLEGLGADDLTSLALDESDNLWVSSAGGGVYWLFRHGPSAGFIQHFTAGAQVFAKQLNVFSDQSFCRIAIGRPGEVAISALEQSVSECQVYPVLHNPLLGATSVDSGGLVWVASDENGMSLVNANQLQRNTVSNLISRHLTALDAMPSGNVWYGAAAGVGMVSRNRLQSEYNTQYPLIPCGPINAIAAVTERQVYIGLSKINSVLFSDKEAAQTRLYSSVWYCDEDGKFNAIAINQSAYDAFSQCEIRNMIWSSESGLWLATSKGLYHLPLKQTELLQVDDLSGCNIIKVCDAPDGSVCALVENKKGLNNVMLLRSTSSYSVQCLDDKDLPAALSSIEVDDSGRLWLGAGRYLYASKQPISKNK